MSFMDNQCRNLHFDPDTLISDLPAGLMLQLRDCLDNNPPTSNWRAFLSIVSNKYKQYTFSSQEVESKFGCHVYNDSPTSKLFSELAGRGMNAAELVYALDQLNLEKILIQIKKYESIDILEQPAIELRIHEGEPLQLEVKAIGFPYPRYQWFKELGYDFEEIPNATDKLLRIKETKSTDAGTYCCRLHNGSKDNQVAFSGYSTIIIDKPKKSVTELYKNGDEDSWTPPSNLDKDTSSDDSQFNPSKALLPYITVQPRNNSVNAGEPVTFTCQACGREPMTYEWYRNEQLVFQTSETFYKIQFARMSDAGMYKCIACNTFGRTPSNAVRLNVDPCNTVVPIDMSPSEIEIIINPKTCMVEFGGNCIFSVEARCREPLLYQWIKDGSPIEGAIQSEYKLYNLQEMELQGSYQCMITAENSRTYKLSNAASLTINISRPPEYTPTDKVALLIGNFDYRNETILKAPKHDVLKLAEIFRSLNFKVVSLLNLTKDEMISAVHEFVNLLGRGVYGVFYFCGHGFEEDGRCYLVPPDAPAGYTVDDCVCADNVQALIQRTDLALLCMILDICRIKNKVCSPSKPQILEPETRTPRGNTVTCYATSCGMYAYEDENNGILVQYLQRYLHHFKPIKDIFAEVQEALGKKISHKEIQIPEFKTNLLEPRRSLADRISTKGYTQAYNEKTLRWYEAHKKPDKREIFIKDIGVKVELEFQSDFSNILHVIVTVKDQGNTENATAFIQDWPSTISLMGSIKIISYNPTRTKISLQDIQKLKSDLNVRICVKYKMKGMDEERKHSKTAVNLGLPLVASLSLWRSRREATEQTED